MGKGRCDERGIFSAHAENRSSEQRGERREVSEAETCGEAAHDRFSGPNTFDLYQSDLSNRKIRTRKPSAWSIHLLALGQTNHQAVARKPIRQFANLRWTSRVLVIHKSTDPKAGVQEPQSSQDDGRLELFHFRWESPDGWDVKLVGNHARRPIRAPWPPQAISAVRPSSGPRPDQLPSGPAGLCPGEVRARDGRAVRCGKPHGLARDHPSCDGNDQRETRSRTAENPAIYENPLKVIREGGVTRALIW